MKNITLSVPEDLLDKARKYASNHGTTLNGLIRDLLQKTTQEELLDVRDIRSHLDELGVDTSTWKFNRDEIYDR